MMKLYTEFEVTKAVAITLNHNDTSSHDIIEKLTPIELPSDEEIKHKLIKEVFVSWFSNDEYERGFEDGAKWMKKQILNQNK